MADTVWPIRLLCWAFVLTRSMAEDAPDVPSEGAAS
jgi:hypothetical protein